LQLHLYVLYNEHKVAFKEQINSRGIVHTLAVEK